MVNQNLGGLFVTNDDDYADTVRMLRVHGAKKKYHNEEIGVNSRLDTIQAAVLRIKLRKIDEWNEGRRQAAYRYNEMLSGLDGVLTPAEESYTKHVYHQYTIRIDSGRRDKVQQHLSDNNVGSFVYYPVTIDRLPVYSDLPKYAVPNSDLCSTEVLSLPIWPSIPAEVQARVVELIKEAL